MNHTATDQDWTLGDDPSERDFDEEIDNEDDDESDMDDFERRLKEMREMR